MEHDKKDGGKIGERGDAFRTGAMVMVMSISSVQASSARIFPSA